MIILMIITYLKNGLVNFMNEATYRKLNPTEAITQALPKIIDAFVAFYGESEREVIENKFKNMLVIGYYRPEKIKNIISIELIDAFLDKISVSKEKRLETKKMYFDDKDLEFPGLHPINQYIKYLNGLKDENSKEQAVKFISNIYTQVTIDNIDTLISSGELSQFNKTIKLYNDMLTQFEKAKSQYSTYIKYSEKCQKLKDNLERKYTGILLDKLKCFFSVEELKQIEEHLKSNCSIKSVSKKTECYFGCTLGDKALIDAFSEKSEEILKNISNWRSNSIINDRIAYFKNNGLDLGDNYEDYIKNPHISKIIPELKKIAENIIKKRYKLNVKMLSEYYQSLEEYQYNIARIEQEGLLNKNHGYDANTYENRLICVYPNIKKKEEGYMMYPILYFPVEIPPRYLDHSLIHELNHVYELNLKKVEGNNYYGICGWDSVGGEINNKKQEVTQLVDYYGEKTRNYELFNEIINELISQEITQILFKNNGYIFNTPENAKIKDGTVYERSVFLVKDFYDRYKREIIESRKSGDMTKLHKVIGKRNFDLLNDLFEVFYEHFSGSSYYSLVQSLKNGEDTEQTRLFFELTNRRDEILSLMEDHVEFITL